jgi:hypothetical protein
MAMQAYQAEKSMISRSVERISGLKRDVEYYEEEITERDKNADSYLSDLPALMDKMFDSLETMVEESEETFGKEIKGVVIS